MPPRGHVLDASTIALWRMDETGGTIADETGLYDLTVTGAISVAGKIDNALQFDGAASNLGGASSPAVVTALKDEWSIETWIKPDGTQAAVQGSGIVVAHVGQFDEDPPNNYLLGLLITNKLNVRVFWEYGGGINVDLETEATLQSGRWHHIGIVKKESATVGTYDVLVYIDGVLRETFLANFNATEGASGSWGLGMAQFTPAPGAQSYYKGLIDDMRISSVARTADEIHASYERGQPFADEVAKYGGGVVIRMDVSLDGFSTVAYRWSRIPGKLDGLNEYDPRITSIGRLDRGFGGDGVVGSSSLDLTLDNTDELADWLMDRTTADALKARFRLYLVAFPSDERPVTSFSWKQIGEYVMMDFPVRNQESIRFSICDDVLGFLDNTITTPTIKQWVDACSASQFESRPQEYLVAEATMLPLAFGNQPVPAYRYTLPIWPLHAIRSLYRYAAICVTTNAADQTVSRLWIEFEDLKADDELSNVSIEVPAYNRRGAQIWAPHKSGAITAGGKTFYVVSAKINITRLWMQLSPNTPEAEWYSQTGQENTVSEGQAISMWGRQMRIWAQGTPLSHVNDGVGAANLLRDLVEYYSIGGGTAKVDETRFETLRKDMQAPIAGWIAGGTESSVVKLREHINNICSGYGIDVFANWYGQMAVSSPGIHNYDVLTGTISSIDEERIANPEERIPSKGERGTPYNRLSYTGFRDRPRFIQKPVPGPFDDPAGTTTTWRRIYPRTLNAFWLEDPTLSPWTANNQAEAKIRPVLKFKTGLEALAFDLGDYVEINWTRNLGADDPYSTALFQLQSMSLDFESHELIIEAQWWDDLRSTTKPYILDDENYLLRYSPGVGETAIVTDSSNAISTNFSVTGQNIAAGDVIVLNDSAQADNVFSRCRALRIATVSATGLTVTDADLNFGGGATLSNTKFAFYRAHTTYPTVVTDPTNYADGSDIYGRVSDVSTADTGVYSDSSAAHHLTHG